MIFLLLIFLIYFPSLSSAQLSTGRMVSGAVTVAVANSVSIIYVIDDSGNIVDDNSGNGVTF